MRTTLNLDDEVFQLARGYARSRSLALGKAVSELVRKGLRAPDSHAHGQWNHGFRLTSGSSHHLGTGQRTRIRDRMTPFLLDVNVLVALGWKGHPDHVRAQNWFLKNARAGWATCPFTQAAFVRIVSNPAFSANAVLPVEALALTLPPISTTPRINSGRRHSLARCPPALWGASGRPPTDYRRLSSRPGTPQEGKTCHIG